MDLLDSDCGEDDINELESRLYAQIHHEPVVLEDRVDNIIEDTKAALNDLVDGPAVSLPLPRGGAPVVMEARILSNKTQHLHNARYWNKDSDNKTTTVKSNSVETKGNPNNIVPENSDEMKKMVSEPKTPHNSIRNKAEKKKNFERQQKQQKPLAVHNKNKASKSQTQSATLINNLRPTNPSKNGPLKRREMKSLKYQQWLTEKKKTKEQCRNRKKEWQKSQENNIQNKKMQEQRISQTANDSKKNKSNKANQLQTPVEIIDLDSDSESDDVILVPLAPAPIIDVDESSSENESTPKEDVSDIKPDISTDLIVENAVDAADVQLDKSLEYKETEENQPQMKPLPVCYSPSNSVLSSDDFIGQKDRKRLLEQNVCADDEDLLLLTSEANCTAVGKDLGKMEDHEMEIESVPQTDIPTSSFETEEACSEPEFVPPSNLETIKENYRVDQAQFRALDVYESESDILEGGIYSKTKPKDTVIRSIGSSSAEQSDDDDVEEIISSSVQKTKRLRKRRASSNRDFEPNKNTNKSDTDDEDNDKGVQKTGVPFIARGVAVERCKSKVRKCSQSSGNGRRTSECGMSDDRFIESLNTLAKGGKASDQSDSEASETEQSASGLTARAIAERVLKKHLKEAACSVPVETEVIEIPEHEIGPSVATKRKSNQRKPNKSDKDDEALPEAACAGLENIFKEIDTMTSRKKRAEASTTIDVDSLAAYEPPQRPTMHMHHKERLTGKHFIGWNEEMRRFYNDSWGGENLSVADILKRTKNTGDGKKQWTIQLEDRFPKSRYRSNVKCLNCCEFGHVRNKCPKPTKPLICFMCGESGHLEPRCPNTICLRCGKKSQYYVRSCNNCSFQNRIICPLCKVRGHGYELCPDKWRRYHSTTEPNAELDSEVKYKKIKNCSLCGARGHLAESCYNGPRFLEYPLAVSTIRSHEKSYKDHAAGGGYDHLIFPESDFFDSPMGFFSFKWSQPHKPGGYYSRFLKAVGMTHLLNNKRKPEIEETAAIVKRMKTYSKDYVANPFTKAAVSNKEGKPHTVTSSSLGQEKENSKDGRSEDAIVNLDSSDESNAEERQTHMIISDEEYRVIDEVCNDTSDEIVIVADHPAPNDNNAASSENVSTSTSNFKTPISCPHNTSSSATETSSSKTIEPPYNLDSDSNYSFSEHFEVPSSDKDGSVEMAEKTKSPEVPNTIVVRKSRPLGPLPDMIPLSSGNDEVNFEDNIINGISMCFNYGDEERGDDLSEIPCECKIFMERCDTEYLFSPEGQIFLRNIAALYDVNVRMEFTSCGYVLFVYGLPANQTKLQVELLKRCKEVRNKSVEFQSQKPPKRVDVLIKYLRDGICQLQGHLGNVNEIYKDLKYHEKQNTKAGYKAADKKRRLLNMILVGQAGLLNGSMHLDQLVSILHSLVNDFKADDVASNDMRNEIEKHWRMIFTGYTHQNYMELVENYRKLPAKNRLTNINIDPNVLGQKVLNTTLTEEQKRRMSNTPKKSVNMQMTKPARTSPPPPAPAFIKQSSAAQDNVNRNNNKTASPRFATPEQRAPRPIIRVNQSNQRASNNMSNQLHKRTITPTPPFANPHQRGSHNNLRLLAQMTPNYEAVLNEIDSQTPRTGAANSVARQPSVFWSRECLKYLDTCIRLSNSGTTMQRLLRVQAKAKNSQLSHNDFCAVVKLLSILQQK